MGSEEANNALEFREDWKEGSSIWRRVGKPQNFYRNQNANFLVPSEGNYHCLEDCSHQERLTRTSGPEASWVESWAEERAPETSSLALLGTLGSRSR